MCQDFLRKVTIVLLFLCWMKRALSLSYDELEQLGVSCPQRDSCLNRTGFDLDNNNTCECSPTCIERGTCCIDSPHHNLNLTYTKECIRTPDKNTGCHESFNVWIVTKCNPKWNGSSHVKELCEGDPLKIGNSLMLVPAFSPTSRNTYRNYFCAVCHADDDDAVLWDVTLTRSEYNNFLGLCEADANQDLVYREDTTEWGYWNHFSPGEAIFVPVKITIHKDGYHLDPCKKDIVWNCAENWGDEDIRKKCETYMAVVKGPVESLQCQHTMRVFRNVHCAICNHVTHFDDFICHAYYDTEFSGACGPSSGPFVTVLFGHKIDKKKCSDAGHKFVTGLETCRPVISRG